MCAETQLLQRAVTDAEGFLLRRLHSALQHDPDVGAARTAIQEERERKAILGRPPPRSGHPTEFTPAMFQEWEENEMYKDVLSVAAEKTKSRLEAARRAFDWRRGAQRERAKEDDEEKERGSHLRGKDTQEQSEKKEEERKAAPGRPGLGDCQDDHEYELPVPSKLLAGAAAAAKGGVGARALEAVRSIFREEIRKEFRRRETEQYRQMTAEMERNVKLSKEERESELMRQQEELSLERKREEAERKLAEKETDGKLQSDSHAREKTSGPGSHARRQTDDHVKEENVQETSQRLENAGEGGTAAELETVPSVSSEGRKTPLVSSTKQTEARRLGENEVTAMSGLRSEGQVQHKEGTKTPAGKVDEVLPTHEEEVVRSLRELSLGLAEASDVYRVTRKRDDRELRRENEVLLDPKEKELEEKPSDVSVPLNTGDTEAGGTRIAHWVVFLSILV